MQEGRKVVQVQVAYKGKPNKNKLLNLTVSKFSGRIKSNKTLSLMKSKSLSQLTNEMKGE